METQERIVHKAHDLFMRYGIRSISMDEIASQLGISKKTIYQYYADKDAVVEAVMQLEIEHLKNDNGRLLKMLRETEEFPGMYSSSALIIYMGLIYILMYI